MVDPTAAGFDVLALDSLRAKVNQQVDAGFMPACGFAFAIDDQIVVDERFGSADPSTRFTVFSATKALVGGVVWQLLGEGKLSVDTRAIELIPGFGAAGRTPEWMAQVTLGQLLTHTSGFPYAPLGPPHWDSRASRVDAFSRWHAAAEPGTSFTYHPTAAHWVVAEMIAVADGRDHCESVAARIIEPLGLTSFSLGDLPSAPSDVTELTLVGEPPTRDEVRAVLGDVDLSLLDAVSAEHLLSFNEDQVRSIGVPGAGGIGTPADLAMYYQALLHNTGELWDPEVLADATGNIRCTFPDPMTGVPSNRSLGVIIAVDDGFGAMRGMGPTVPAGTFGHNGAAGQIVWADPSSGVSFALTTSGVDPNFLREARRILSLAAKAGACLPSPS